MSKPARQIWSKLNGERQSLLKAWENYARLTLPKLLLPDGWDKQAEQPHDYQSLGAQAVNHVTNKMMIAMFAPSRPFFRAQPGDNTVAKANAAGIQEQDIQDSLSDTERRAVSELDATGQRPKLYQLMRHLIVIGNVLLHRDGDRLRVMGVRYFCVKRNVNGEVHTLIVREKVCFDELDPAVQALLPEAKKKKDDAKVELFKVILRQNDGSYAMTQWVDDVNLGDFDNSYNKSWPTAEECDYTVHTWDLADEHDYGTSLVEDYVGDFEAMSAMSEAVVDGGILGAEFRWMINPSGMTSVQDVQESENGDCLPGVPADVAATQVNNGSQIQQLLAVLERWERRIGRGFLMGSAVQRDAERVTAEEIRVMAMELESAFGGVYSALAPTLQRPVAFWLLKRIGVDLKGTDFKLTIITGLDALSRNSDVENLKLALQDAAMTANLPPAVQAELSMQKLLAFIGNGRGIDLRKFFKTEAEKAADREQAAQQQAMMSAADSAGQQVGAPQ